MGALIGSTVTLDYGKFKGKQNTTNGIISFRGVKFADAPTKNLRWAAPISPPSKNLGTVDASKFGAECIRTTQTTVATKTSEDCLFGNIFVPNNTHVGDNLPVLVWFHGGGFQSGSTHSFLPDLLMASSSQPFVFASFEYRLGQFGFLGGSEIASNGSINAGLLDQRAALKWVQRYIGQFGGDSGHVTVWGQSAGAGSIMYHLMANGGDTEGLFHAAIMDSPPLVYTPAFNDAYDEDIFQQFAQLAGCGSGTSAAKKGQLSCLRGLTSTAVAKAGSKLLDARPDTLFLFAPVVDNALIQERPVEAYQAGRFAHIPVISGSNTNEGAHWASTIPDPAANTSLANATETTVFNFLIGQYPNLTSESIINTGFSLYPLNDFGGNVSLQGQQMYGEARYICSALMATPAVPAFGDSAYQYHYDNPHLGSNHEDELQAFFNPPTDADHNDLALFEIMREYLTSFVTTGKPVSKSGPEWQPVNSDSSFSRILFNPQNSVMERVDDALVSRCNFWHGITNENLT
ncbi:Lipase 1 [Psilocybe cubensis]|uniref:Lipase 1 n=2 Tax=Psilocybe cubensis TaxID=181762 RepID=A0ACB8GX54_PSICU|nr:Lipase 1 [Psilocybe cubensis]KAH9480174.1 Lipase 1 [Psilocybe cubensis]